MTREDMKALQKAESWRERRKKLMNEGVPDEKVAPYLVAEAQALQDAAHGILQRLQKAAVAP